MPAYRPRSRAYNAGRRYAGRCRCARRAADKATRNVLLADDLVYTHSNAVIDTKPSYIDGILGGRWA